MVENCIGDERKVGIGKKVEKKSMVEGKIKRGVVMVVSSNCKEISLGEVYIKLFRGRRIKMKMESEEKKMEGKDGV